MKPQIRRWSRWKCCKRWLRCWWMAVSGRWEGCTWAGVARCIVQVWCSVLQCLQCGAVCCSVRQHVVLFCSVLQCFAVCYNILQCVAVCCSVCCKVFCGVIRCDTVLFSPQPLSSSSFPTSSPYSVAPNSRSTLATSSSLCLLANASGVSLCCSMRAQRHE